MKNKEKIPFIITAVVFVSLLVFLAYAHANVQETKKNTQEQREIYYEKNLEEQIEENLVPAEWTTEPITATELSYAGEAEPTETTQGEVVFKKIKGCPWSTDTQKSIWKWCKKYDVCFELIMSMAKTESNYDAKAIGDNGEAWGAWQIHPRQWISVINRLGYAAEDMFNPVKAGRVCAYIMRAHFKKYPDVEFALMAWNGGGTYAMAKVDSGNISDYAKTISSWSMKLERRKEK